jgi:molecular chaperone GrpE
MWAEKEEAAKEEAAAEEVEEQVGPMTAEEAAKLKADLKVAQKALEETAKALADTKDKLHRSLADLENTVRIAKKDVANAKEFGIKGFAMKMFDVLDTVELCLGNLPKPADVESNSHLESAIIALDSTKKQFAKVMADFEVHPLETKVGDKFDANVHNAVFEMQPTHADHKPHHVGVIIKHGWSRQGNLLRPTHVGVVAKH